MAKVLQALMLIAGLLWSGVCFAQCRVLPPQPKKTSTKQQLPPCHQQTPAQQQDDCQEDGCTASYTDAEKSFDAAVDLVQSFEILHLTSFVSVQTRAFDLHVIARPPNSISILRI